MTTLPLRFAAPWVLLFLPVGIFYLAWAYRRSFVNLSAGRRQLVLFFRILTITVLTLLCAAPTLMLPSRSSPVVFLVDVSASVPESMLKAARQFVTQAIANRGDQTIEVVSFAARAERVTVDANGPHIERHDTGDTDLEQALTFARGLIPDGTPRLVLLTDGNVSHPGALAAVERAAREGLSLDVVELPKGAIRDARVTELRLPDILRRQEPTRISAMLDASRSAKATVRLEENNFLVKSQEVQLKGGPQAVDFEFEPTVSGLVRYSVQVSIAADELPDNDRFTQLASVGGPPRVLLAASTPEEGSHLEQALSAQDMTVEAISAGSLPSTVEGLIGYDEVILAGIAPWRLDRLRQGALATYVRDTGGGLLFVSGREGLHRDPDGKKGALDTLLPLELAAPSEKQEPPVAMTLLVDRSGSMVGEKLNFAKQAALAVVDKLSPQDQVGVIAFAADYEWITPLGPLEDKEKVKATLSSLGAGGGTRFYPALEEAFFTLGSSEAAVKHAILLTDGESTDPNIFPALLAKMRAAAITVSTVAIGRQADTKLLSEIAKLGGGRFTLATSASQVPQIFVKETETVQRDAAQRRDSQARVAKPVRELAGIDFATSPALSGYVRTKAKANTEVLLETGRQDPLLARWHYGLGAVVAFASDATSVWGARWLSWSGFGKLWSQLARAVGRPRIRHDLQLALSMRGAHTLLMTVDAVDPEGRLLQDLEVRARVIDGAQGTHEVALRQVGPGRYASELTVPEGSVIARPVGVRGGRQLDGDWTVLALPYPEELKRIGENRPFLEELIKKGHGTFLRSPTELREVKTALPQARPLLIPLGLFAVALFLLDLVLRRARWESR